MREMTMSIALHGKRILVTQAQDFMGPALCDTLTQWGATVVPDTHDVTPPSAPAQILAAAGDIDVLVLNLGIPAARTAVAAISDEEWRGAFAAMVDPLPRFTRVALPPMMARRSGKIILIGSASALRGIPNAATYCAARAAQIGFVRAVGLEAAKHNVQVNAIAQNFVDNPTYFPADVQANPKFSERLKREVPLGRLVAAEEDANFVAYLCTDAADCFVGQVFPVCGGWV
jgi:2-keto-3-deoxy-L-fuconate dehydrogenase